VLAHLQSSGIRPYNIAARRRRLPILGIVGSWDQPTTKGPLCPGIRRYVVQSKIMRQELQRYHLVPEDGIEVVGWPQMDFYKKPGLMQPREMFLSSIDIPLNRRLLVFAAYSARLGPHEPGIARYLAAQIQKGGYGEPCTLLIRPHPKDDQWEERFGALHAPPNVIVQHAEWGRLEYLANLLYHADVLLASSGTVALDAAALDTCVINIAFDGDLEVDYYESVRRWHEMEHYAAVVRSEGVRLVESYQALDQAISTYLRNPDTDRKGRERLCREQLEPFDGRASERLVALIVQEAYQSAQRLKQRV
jgi:CDP-glycerol glycerophosphotransferase (TagB/SpsB family)